MRKSLHFFSIVFNPLLIVSQLFWVLLLVYPEIYSLNYANNNDWIIVHGGILCFGTLVMPAVSILFLRLAGYIKDYQLNKANERIVPFYFVVFWYCFSTYLFSSKLEVGQHFLVILGVSTLLIAFMTLTTSWYRFCIHCAALSGAAGFMTAIALQSHHFGIIWPLSFTFLIAGTIGSARLYLNLHNLNQVIIGSSLGFTICFSGLYFLW